VTVLNAKSVIFVIFCFRCGKILGQRAKRYAPALFQFDSCDLTASPLQTYELSILYIKESVGSKPSIHAVWRKKSGCFFPRERSKVTIIVKRSAGNGVHETVPGATVNRRALRNKLPHECRSSSGY
jgi:hypothetical protein